MYILCDVGGTNTRIGTSSDGLTLDNHIMFETVVTYTLGLEKLVNEIKNLVSGETVQSIILGVPGTLNKDKGMLVNAPHLRDWQDSELKKDLVEIFKCDVQLENDCALVGLGEATHGAGIKYSIVAYVTLSTGVGGVKIENKEIDKNSIGFEIGHHQLEKNLTFEDLVSGTAIKKKYNIEPKEILDTEVWELYSDDVARGIANVIRFWSPDIIVIGGSMSRSLLFERLNLSVKNLCQEYRTIPKIVQAKLDTIGGLYGGLSILSNKVVR